MFVVGKIDGMEVVGKFKGERIDSILHIILASDMPKSKTKSGNTLSDIDILQ